MEKYAIFQQQETEMTITDLPEDLDHIPVILNDEMPMAEAYEVVLDMLHSDASVTVMMIGESRHAASVQSCETRISSRLDVYSATFDTVSEVEHVWTSSVPGLERLQVLWVRRGLAVLISRSALPKGLPRRKSPNRQGRNRRARGTQTRVKSKKDFRGSQAGRPLNLIKAHSYGNDAIHQVKDPMENNPSQNASTSRNYGSVLGSPNKDPSPCDKLSGSRFRNAKEKSLGDFMRFNCPEYNSDRQNVGPSAGNTSDDKRIFRSNHISVKRPQVHKFLPEFSDCQRRSASTNPSDVVSPMTEIFDDIPCKNTTTASVACVEPGAVAIVSNASVSATEDDTLETLPSRCTNLSLVASERRGRDTSSVFPVASISDVELESNLNLDPKVRLPNSEENVNFGEIQHPAAGANSTRTKNYCMKNNGSERKVSFNLPGTDQTTRVGPSSCIEPSVKPKAVIANSPSSPNGKGKRSSAKNRRRKESYFNREYSPTRVKTQTMEKVC